MQEIKYYSMYSEDVSIKGKAKTKYVLPYLHPMSEKKRRKSITLNGKHTMRKQNTAREMLEKIIEKSLGEEIIIERNKTFEEVAKEWIKVRKFEVKGSTYATDQKILNIILNDRFKKQKKYLIRKITTKTLQDVFDKLFEKGLSEVYIRNHKIVFKRIFSYALDKKYIATIVPISSVKLHKRTVTIEDLENEIPKFLERYELEQVLDVLYKKYPPYAEVFDVQANTGMRISELLALTEKDIDGNYLHIKGTYDNYTGSPTRRKKTAPKNKQSFRKIVIGNRIRDIINQRILRNNIDGLITKEGYIFVTRRKNPYSVNSLNNFMHKHEKLFLTDTRVTTHVFRHTHVSLLAEQPDIQLHEIIDRVGHAGKGTTEKIYLHVTEKSKESLLEKLNKMESKSPFSAPYEQ